MKKIIAKEVASGNIDFSYYFDGDCFSNEAGVNYAIYIPQTRHMRGFNADEYEQIKAGARDVLDCYDEDFDDFADYVRDLGENYSDKIIVDLHEWARILTELNTEEIADFLTITTGVKWAVDNFYGYSQGDYCEVVYCTEVYTEKAIEEVGKLWLGCGTEFIIDGCGGYFVTDEIRWKEGRELRETLANMYGCKPEEIEVYLYDGEHMEIDYKVMED